MPLFAYKLKKYRCTVKQTMNLKLNIHLHKFVLQNTMFKTCMTAF